MNITTLIGRLGTDPELRFTQDGKTVCEFRLAVDNPRRDDPDWFTIVAWGKLAEAVAEHKGTGDQVGITGRLHPQQWEIEDGDKRSTVKVVADQVEFLARKRQEAHAN